MWKWLLSALTFTVLLSCASDAQAWHHRRGGGGGSGCGGGGGGAGYGYAAYPASYGYSSMAFGGCSGMTAGYGGYGLGGYAFAPQGLGLATGTAGLGSYNLNGQLYTWNGQYDTAGNMVLAAASATPTLSGTANQPGQRTLGSSEASEPARGNYPAGSTWKADENGILRPFRQDSGKRE